MAFQSSPLITKHFLALFRPGFVSGKRLAPPTQIDFSGGTFRLWAALASAPVAHRAIKLPVQVGLIEEQFVGRARGGQAEASHLRVECKVLALVRVALQHPYRFQGMVKRSYDSSTLLISLVILEFFRFSSSFLVAVGTALTDVSANRQSERPNALTMLFRIVFDM